MPLVAVIMGSSSDWETMREAASTLSEMGIEYEKKIVSAHRTPGLMYSFAKEAESRGIEVIIAGAGGAAHLPGMTASLTSLPVIGVPVKSRSLNGLDSLLSIVQMPSGIPVATVAINGAKNAAILAARILGIKHPEIAEKVKAMMQNQEEKVLKEKIE